MELTFWLTVSIVLVLWLAVWPLLVVDFLVLLRSLVSACLPCTLSPSAIGIFFSILFSFSNAPTLCALDPFSRQNVHGCHCRKKKKSSNTAVDTDLNIRRSEVLSSLQCTLTVLVLLWTKITERSSTYTSTQPHGFQSALLTF
jgi:hypothetical protein